MKRISVLAIAFAALSTENAVAQRVDAASALLKDREGKIVGTVALRQTPDAGVLMNVSIDGLPIGNYAFHVHETGKCDGDFSSAGGHFAPRARKHGVLSEGGPHAGDLPNLHIVAAKYNVEIFAREFSLNKGKGSIFDDDGSALIVHRGIDDYATQPAGGAGEKVACGVITNKIIDGAP
ncbi:MAG: superoxide dismutase family protein [Hyphomicrobium sp.]|nr:superoxide dismutase family protein [Hyphomicrobium sp.]